MGRSPASRTIAGFNLPIPMSFATRLLRTVWMTPEEVRASADRHRSPLVVRCMEDYLAGARHPLSLVYTDPSVAALG